MKEFSFKYLASIAVYKVYELKDILRDKRLCKHLWIEFLINPDAARISRYRLHNYTVKNSLEKALSWYLAFRWLFRKNSVLEELYKKKKLNSYPIRDRYYRENYRDFLKGIIYAEIC